MAEIEIDVTLPDFGPLTERIRSNLRSTSVGLTRMLASRVRENLSGKVLRARSGRLRGAVRSQLIETKDTIGGRVYVQGVPYAAIHEFGGRTKPHEIAARHSASLAFVWKGEMRFFKKVNHPGSRIPERSYMRSALEDMRDEIKASYEDVIEASKS